MRGVVGTRAPSLTFGLELGDGPLAAVDFQKLSRAEDGDAPKGPELPKVSIPADHVKEDVGSKAT